MKKKKKREYLKILELSDKASRDDIENAYSHFVKLYSFGDSPEIYPLKDEIDSNERKNILSDIDKAYKALVGEDAVNRMEFTAEFEPQEINLDEEEAATIPQEEIIEYSEENQEEPVVEFVEQDELIVEIPVAKMEDDMDESEEPVVEIPESEEVIAGKKENEVSETDAQVGLEIELPLDEEGEAVIEQEEIEEEQVIETQDNEVRKNEIPVGIELELPLDENYSDIGEGEEPVIEIDGNEISKNEISVEIEYSTDEQSFNESENIHDEKIEKIVDIEEITGKYLKKKRESSGRKVKELAGVLGISYKDIVNIENEKFEKLSDAGYLRWLIKAYAKLLEIDEAKSAEDYMKRYRSKK